MASYSIRNRNLNKFDKDGNRKKPNWEYRFNIASVDGKRKQLSRSGFATKKEAEKAATKALAEYNRAGQVFEPSEISFSDYLDYWLNTYCKYNIADATMEAYKSIIRIHIKPKLGHYKLSSLTTDILQTFLNNIYSERGFSKNYLNSIKKVLKGSLKYAKVTAKYIQENPASDLILPKVSVKSTNKGEFNEEIIILENDEVERILERFKDVPYQYYAFLTAYYTGLRIGECYGLTWDSVDFDNKTITVEKACKKIAREGKVSDNGVVRGVRGKATTRWYFGECKTPSSYRTIEIGDTLVNALKQYKQWQEDNEKVYAEYYTRHFIKDEVTDNMKQVKRIISMPTLDYMPPLEEVKPVFVKENGEFRGTDSVRYASRIINYELGIRFNFHALRHTHATRLIETNVPVKTVSERLGHSSIRTTLDTYTHVTKKMQVQAVAAFEAIGIKNMLTSL